MSSGDLDLFVIGAGSGGVRAGRVAATYGAKVMVAEAFRIGGTCVIRGCVPKKLMVLASRFADSFAEAAGFGWQLPSPTFDWSALVAAKEAEITRLSGLYKANLENAGADLVQSKARLVDDHHVMIEATGEIKYAKKILIATGATPDRELNIAGVEHTLSTDEIFDLPELPKKLLVIGSGYIAVEFAALFARFGTEVTLCYRADKVLRGFDEDLRLALEEGLSAAKIQLRPEVLPVSIDKSASGLHVVFGPADQGTFDQVLLATGRRPHIDGLGLEAVGVVCNARGAIEIDNRCRTNIGSIYAVGDVTPSPNLTPVAIRQGQAFADREFGGREVSFEVAGVPTVVFSTPEVATLGMSEAQAVAAYPSVDVYKAVFRPMRATLSGRNEKMMFKMLVDADSDLVLGVHILGADAGEMIQLLGVCQTLGAKKADYDATLAVHPTAAEELVTMRTPSARHRR